MLDRLDRYLLKQIVTPLVMTLGVAALLLLLERMLRLFDFVVNQGGPVDVVWRMLVNLVPHYMGLALPVGLFLGILLAMRKLSLNSELDAITTSGRGLPRLVRPVMGLTLVLMVVNTILVGFVQPYSRYAYRGLVFDLRSGALGASIRIGDFVTIADNVVLRIEGSRKGGTELFGIFLQRTNTDGSQIAVTAKRGGFFSTSDDQTILLRLFDGVLADLDEGANKPRVLTFDQQDLTIDLPVIEEFRERGDEELELTLPELIAAARDPTLSPDLRDGVRANLHWRMVHTVTFLVLPLLAMALGITNRRTGSSLGLVVGLVLLVSYNELMEVAETTVATEGISPYAVMWPLFALFAAISLFFFYRVAFGVGAQPLRWIEGAWTAAATRLAGLAERMNEALT